MTALEVEAALQTIPTLAEWLRWRGWRLLETGMWIPTLNDTDQPIGDFSMGAALMVQMMVDMQRDQ